LGILRGCLNRGYREGFLQCHPDQDYQNYLVSHSNSIRQQFVGALSGYDPGKGMVRITVTPC
jgi:putative protease